MKTRNLLLCLVLVLVLPVFLIACGEDEPEESENQDGEESSGVTLSETFSASEGGLDLNFNYPEGWVTSAESGQIVLASSQAALDMILTSPIESVELPADSYGLQMMILPAADMPPDSTPASLLGMFTEAGEEGVAFGSVEEIEVNGSDAAKIPVTYAQSSGEVYLVNLGEFYLMVFAAAPDYSDYEATTQAIVESVQAG